MMIICADCQGTWMRPSPLGPCPTRCPECSLRRLRKQQADWVKAHPERIRASRVRHARAYPERARSRTLKAKYGITSEDFQAILTAQGDQCGICFKDVDASESIPHFDHDHATGEPRGVLCASCNTKLGWFEKRKIRIYEYLDNPPAREVLQARRSN